MNRSELLELHASLTDEARKLVVLKNRDYGESDDPFRNFRRWGLWGILIRMGDKLARLETFTERGSLAVATEQVHDTIIDVINYAVLFEGYNQDADSKGSGTGNTAQPGPARPADQRLEPRRANSRAGDLGGDSRGARRDNITETRGTTQLISEGFTVRTGPGCGGRKSMDSKPRRRKVKR